MFPQALFPPEDEWETRNGGETTYCSWCGSMNPVLLLSLMRNGKCTLGPTDKHYKVYVDHGVNNKTDKFYFQHFDPPQKHEFIELMNMKPRPFKIGYPGRFYVMPYFCALGSKSEGG